MYCNDVSVRGLRWQVPAEVGVSVPNYPKLITDIAVRRGITDFDAYFNASLKNSMPDPLTMKDMDRAIERIAAGIHSGERICVYGDYDVDGATSASIILRYIGSCGHPADHLSFYIPARLEEGYGINVGAVEKIAADQVTLIIAVDCGSTSFEPIARARELGIDVVVLDHHNLSDAGLPDAVVVNPKRSDCEAGLSYLCAAGLVFLTVVGLRRYMREQQMFRDLREEPQIEALLGLAALGTIADLVPLVGLNRAYVKVGLPMMQHNPGLMALARENELTQPQFTAHSCGFILGPCINAGGRIDDTRLGTELLASDDPARIRELASLLFTLNSDRRGMQAEMVEQAKQAAAARPQDKVIVIYDDLWHPGIVGLAAARVKDFVEKSAIVIGQDGKGSARAMDGFDIGGAIVEAHSQGILIKGGGHAAAGGVTIDPARVDEFREFMNRKAESYVRPALSVDAIIRAGSLKPADVDRFEILGPFGKDNSMPRLVISGATVIQTRLLKEKHVKAVLECDGISWDAILFNAHDTVLGKALLSAEGKKVDLLGTLSVNSYNGRHSVQVRPEDLMVSPF